MLYKNYTQDQFIEAIKSSTSISKALTKLGLSPKGGNYATTKKLIEKLKLNTDHMKGQGWSDGITIGPKRPLSDYLSNKHGISSHKLRNRLIKSGTLEPQCANCGGTTWLCRPIPLELDHVDGNHLNNKLNNLRLLCPNCHALTPTYRRSKRSIKS